MLSVKIQILVVAIPFYLKSCRRRTFTVEFVKIEHNQLRLLLDRDDQGLNGTYHIHSK